MRCQRHHARRHLRCGRASRDRSRLRRRGLVRLFFSQDSNGLAKFNDSLGPSSINVGERLNQVNPRLRPVENCFFLQGQLTCPTANGTLRDELVDDSLWIPIGKRGLEYRPVRFAFEVEKGKDDPPAWLGHTLRFREESKDILVQQVRENRKERDKIRDRIFGGNRWVIIGDKTPVRTVTFLAGIVQDVFENIGSDKPTRQIVSEPVGKAPTPTADINEGVVSLQSER